MVGLGCGARSYTRSCHYSTEYAVGKTGIQAILRDYVSRPEEAFDWASHGFRLDAEDQCRRYAVKSLLRAEGLALDDFARALGCEAFESLPELAELIEQGLAVRQAGRLRLTEAGLERSDVIGPWLYSARVRERMETYHLR